MNLQFFACPLTRALYQDYNKNWVFAGNAKSVLRIGEQDEI
jgi:hypothetical protein